MGEICKMSIVIFLCASVVIQQKYHQLEVAPSGAGAECFSRAGLTAYCTKTKLYSLVLVKMDHTLYGENIFWFCLQCPPALLLSDLSLEFHEKGTVIIFVKVTSN